MLSGRSEEISNLEQFYEKPGSQLVVVYGQSGVGKTTLVREFAADKSCFYYACREASEREQCRQWGREISAGSALLPQFPTWQELFAGSFSEIRRKQVLILDEFQYIIKGSSGFLKELISFIHQHRETYEVLVILISSSISWVENSMVKRIGEAAYSLSGLLKIRPLDFFQIRKAFPGYTVEDAVYLYGMLGGIPGLWKHMSPEKNLKENICETMISPEGALFGECKRLLSEELRELGIYQTILSALADGNHKLNDIYACTGFSRAKISVYLKNLMELEIIEKVFSYDTEGRENVQKGVYRISNPFVHFYFTYLYPNLSRLETEDGEVFYQEYIYPTLRQYTAPYFREICEIYLIRKASRGELPFKVSGCGEWVGKAGSIDIILQSERGETVLCCCNWMKPLLPYEDYEKLLFLAKQAKLEADEIWLFSVGRFDEKLSLEAKMKQNLRLLPVREILV